MRFLLLERNLEKGSCPSLLPEVTFYCNNLDNSSSKRSVDSQERQLICSSVEMRQVQNQTGGEYLEILLEALNEVARIIMLTAGW